MDKYYEYIYYLAQKTNKLVEKKLNVSDYGVTWIAFVKGLIIGLLIYHFFIN